MGCQMKGITLQQAERLVGHNYNRRGYEEAIKTLTDATFAAMPYLVPFAGGDRAGMLGFENAEAFAKRKWAEQEHYEQRYANQIRAVHKWQAEKRARGVPTNRTMPKEVRLKLQDGRTEGVLQTPRIPTPEG